MMNDKWIGIEEAAEYLGLAYITLAFCSNQIFKGCTLADCELSKRLTLVSVRHIFKKQQNQHISVCFKE